VIGAESASEAIARDFLSTATATGIGHGWVLVHRSGAILSDANMESLVFSSIQEATKFAGRYLCDAEDYTLQVWLDDSDSRETAIYTNAAQ